MTYITSRKSVQHRQMTLEELLFMTEIPQCAINSDPTSTYTYVCENLSREIQARVDVDKTTAKLAEFNRKTQTLREHNPRSDLYYTFHIPKKSGGLRRIDAPNEELKQALRDLKDIFENDFGVLYHTSAFAYIKGRNTVKAVKRHQENKSRWFGKYDLHDFFGSTTPEFVMKMLSMVFPFSEIVQSPYGKAELEKALSLAFLNGGLPQGTPLSPTLTNIMMIPVDHTVSNTLRDFNKQKYVYTRYADDFLVSSQYNFNFREIEKLIIDTLKKFDAPFTINSAKTRYGSSSGANWNLGVMLNKDNIITIGSKKKRQFQAMLNSYILDRRNNRPWNISDIRVLDGYRSYYKMIEGDTIDKIVEHIGKKYGVNVAEMIHEDLKN